MSDNTLPPRIFTSLNYAERNFHLLQMTASGFINGQLVAFPSSGIFPSGEALFFDQQQNIEHPKYGTPFNPKVFAGYNGYKWKSPSGVYALVQSGVSFYQQLNPIVGVSGLQPYASGDVNIKYMHNSPNPSGGTGKLDKLPYDFSFNPDDFLIRNSG